MTRYILDTHVLIWFLENNPRLSVGLREDIEYMQYGFCVSFLSLLEIDNLRKLKKIDIQFSYEEILKQLDDSYISVYFGDFDDLKLNSLEMKYVDGKSHGDYIDRMIIAMSISKKLTCISADEKFPYYRSDGLMLLEI